jgi:hypothetical protein
MCFHHLRPVGDRATDQIDRYLLIATLACNNT